MSLLLNQLNQFGGSKLLPLANKKIAVLVSGGVDSCVASLLLRNRGCRELVGVFMKNWEDDENEERCQSQLETDRSDAQFVCQKLDMEFREVNFVKEYWHHVFTHLMDDYVNGLTPNPDVLCNQRVKFGAFLDYAKANLDSDLVATGHYAGSTNGPFYENGSSSSSGVSLLRAVDEVKDQTFFLSQVHQKSLERVIFPLQSYAKNQVKQIAFESGFERIVARKSSKGICFIGKRNFQSFIEKYLRPNPGKFVDLDTKQVVGEHQGFHYWTLGQHAKIQGFPHKYFVARKSDPRDNIIYVVSHTNHRSLFSDTFTTMTPHWIGHEPEALKRGNQLNCMYKFQQKDPLSPCAISTVRDNDLQVKLDAPQRSLTPGQFAAFYSDNRCLGSGRIKSVL